MKLRSALTNLGLAIGSVLVFFLLMELALRIGGYQMREARILCLDAIIGNVYCPGLTAPLDDQNGGKTIVSFNSEGLADREYSLSRKPNTVRIELFGDSVTASLYTPEENKFKAIWEKELAGATGKPVEVMNFGVDGLGTWEELQLFHLKGARFSPDYVVVAFYWGNDTWNNVASRDKGRPNPLKDEYGEPPLARRLQVRHRYAIRWMWNHSATYQFLDTLKDTIEQSRAYRADIKVVPAQSGGGEQVVYDGAFIWNSEAWTLSRELLVKFKEESDRLGAKLIVFHLPTLDQITKPKPLPYQEFRQFLDEHSIAGIDAFDELEKLSNADKRRLYIGDRWHLSAAGHRFYADATLPKLAGIIEIGAKR